MSNLTVVNEPKYEIRLDKVEIEFLYMLMYHNMCAPDKAPLMPLYLQIKDVLDLSSDMEDALTKKYEDYLIC